MKFRSAALSFAFAALSAAPVACTVLNDMNGYAGGLADTAEPVVDTGLKVDSSTDSGPKDSATADMGTDTKTTPDTGSDTSVTDSMVTMDTGTVPDTAMPDTMVSDMGSDAPVGCHVVVNEVQTAGAGSGTAEEEFVELYNPCDSSFDLTSYKVVYRSATGTADVMVATLVAGKTIAAKGFFVVGNGTFATTADATFAGIASLSASAGAVGVRDPAGTLLDSVAYGSGVAAGHAFIEGTPASAPVGGASISRVPVGTDTANNSVDFRPTTSTPKS